MSKFLTQKNDIVHTKISFDESPSEKPLNGSFEERKLANRRLKGWNKQIKSRSVDKKRDNSKKQHNYAAYNFVTGKRLIPSVGRKLKQNKEVKRGLQNQFAQAANNPAALRGDIKRLASSLGIDDTTDAILAGAGTAAAIYGLNTNRVNSKKYKKAIEALQERYVDRKAYNQQLGEELGNWRELAEAIADASKRTSATEETIVSDFSKQIMYGRGY